MSASTDPADSIITCVVFSKDRPLQLDGVLTSLFKCNSDAGLLKTYVIYKASNANVDGHYNDLINTHSGVNFIREDNFKANLLNIIRLSKWLFFLVDDNIFVRKFSLVTVLKALNTHTKVLGFSLRLGKNTQYCYMHQKKQRLPHFDEVGEGVLKFRWIDAQLDFCYPLEVASSIYRSKDIISFLEKADFWNPNYLEVRLAEYAKQFRKTHPLLLCFEKSVTFCNPVNLVQSNGKNLTGIQIGYTTEKLISSFADGNRIDTESYQDFTPNSPHQEVQLILRNNGDCAVLPPDNAPPVVSVVIPCYGQAKYLSEALESVVAQTFNNWEAIIVNDGSLDNTSGTALSLIQKYPNKKIYLLETENRGVAAARNKGIQFARGKYVLPLDADDVLLPSMLKKAVAILDRKKNIGYVYTGMIQFGDVHRKIPARRWRPEKLIRNCRVHYCSLMRHRMWEIVGGYNQNMKMYEDWDFWLSCLEHGFRGKRIRSPQFLYRVQKSGRYALSVPKHKELCALIAQNHPKLYSSTSTFVRGQ